MSEWKKGFPTKPGTYLMKLYPQGIISCGTFNRPEVMVVKVSQGANSLVFVGDNNFLYPLEAAFPHHVPIELDQGPYLPCEKTLEAYFEPFMDFYLNEYNKPNVELMEEAIVTELGVDW